MYSLKSPSIKLLGHCAARLLCLSMSLFSYVLTYRVKFSCTGSILFKFSYKHLLKLQMLLDHLCVVLTAPFHHTHPILSMCLIAIITLKNVLWEF